MNRDPRRLLDDYANEVRRLSPGQLKSEFQRMANQGRLAKADILRKEAQRREIDWKKVGGMTRDYFVFEVMTEVRFDKNDVDLLMEFSSRHYDAKCKSLSQPGGFIYGMKNAISPIPGEANPPATATWKLSISDLDLLCKVVEPIVNADREKVPLFMQLRELLLDAGDKYRELNAHLRRD